MLWGIFNNVPLDELLDINNIFSDVMTYFVDLMNKQYSLREGK